MCHDVTDYYDPLWLTHLQDLFIGSYHSSELDELVHIVVMNRMSISQDESISQQSKILKVTCNFVVFTCNCHLLSFEEKTSPQLHEDAYQWFIARLQYLQCIGNGDTADMLLIIVAPVMEILMKMTG